MNHFIQGFFYPFKCINLFFKFPKLIAYSIVPMIINMIIYGTIFYFTYKWITGKTSEMVTANESNKILFGLIQTFLKIFSFFLVLLICYFLFIVFGGIVAAPFNDRISRLIGEKLFEEKVSNNLTFFKEAVVSIKEELKKILFYFLIIIPLFLINFIPMIGSTISVIFGTGFSFFYNALDYLDYPLSRRLVPFRQKLKVVNSKKTLSYGFGGIAFILTFLPVINVLFNPLLVAAGTKLFFEKGYDKSIK